MTAVTGTARLDLVRAASGPAAHRRVGGARWARFVARRRRCVQPPVPQREVAARPRAARELARASCDPRSFARAHVDRGPRRVADGLDPRRHPRARDHLPRGRPHEGRRAARPRRAGRRGARRTRRAHPRRAARRRRDERRGGARGDPRAGAASPSPSGPSLVFGRAVGLAAWCFGARRGARSPRSRTTSKGANGVAAGVVAARVPPPSARSALRSVAGVAEPDGLGGPARAVRRPRVQPSRSRCSSASSRGSPPRSVAIGWRRVREAGTGLFARAAGHLARPRGAPRARSRGASSASGIAVTLAAAFAYSVLAGSIVGLFNRFVVAEPDVPEVHRAGRRRSTGSRTRSRPRWRSTGASRWARGRSRSIAAAAHRRGARPRRAAGRHERRLAPRCSTASR